MLTYKSSRSCCLLGARLTPLDFYFKFNTGKLEFEDPVVHALCARGSWWGLDALTRSTIAYANLELPEEYRCLVTGSPYEVKTLVEKCMRHGNPLASATKLKFLFVILPLRRPAQYKLSSSQGIDFVARIVTAMSDVYAQSTGPDAEAQKRRWMAAFMDVCTWMIYDEGMIPVITVARIEPTVITKLLFTLFEAYDVFRSISISSSLPLILPA